MITVACVLRSGGDYELKHVWALKRAVERHLPQRHYFRVLTDITFAGRWERTLDHAWPTWWAKLELFRPGVFDGPVLYLDLDSVITGDLTELASYRGRLAMIADFNRPQFLQSGVMAWTPGPHTHYLWACFEQAPEEHMRNFRGDGQFLNAYAQDPKPEVLQELYPGQIISYKRDVRSGFGTFVVEPDREVPKDARVICFHGEPRPWDTNLWEE